MALFQRVCELDLEGIVAKQKFGPYVTEREQSTWFKILNREYSQMQGREDCLSVERHQEPVAGWHSCVVASAVRFANPSRRSTNRMRRSTAGFHSETESHRTARLPP